MSGLTQEAFQKIEKIVSEIAEREACRLYDLEYVGSSHGRVLRVFIDKGGDGTVSIEDCANVSRGLNVILDEQPDLIPGDAYQLEVSSPGLERQLRKDWHFLGAIGRSVDVKLTQTLGETGVTEKRWLGTKKFSAKLTGFAEGKAELTLEDGTVANLPLAVFEKIKTVFEVAPQGKKKN